MKKIIIFLLIFSTCGGRTYSLEECYEAVDEFEQSMRSPLVYVTQGALTSKAIRNGDIDTLILRVSLFGNEDPLPISEGPFPYNSSINYIYLANYESYIINNEQNIETVYTDLPELYFEDFIDKSVIVNPNIAIKYKDHPVAYLVSVRLNVYLYVEQEARLNLLHKEASFETIALKDFFMGLTNKSREETWYPYAAYMGIDRNEYYSQEKYKNSLIELKPLVSEAAYFFDDHPECLDIPKFESYKSDLSGLYGEILDEIDFFNEKESAETTIYPNSRLFIEYTPWNVMDY